MPIDTREWLPRAQRQKRTFKDRETPLAWFLAPSRKGGPKAHRKLLKHQGFVGSMGRRGNPYDNAAAASLIRTLKVEAVYIAGYETFEDVAAHLPRLVEEVDDKARLHSALGYLSPARYEEIHRLPVDKTAA